MGNEEERTVHIFDITSIVEQVDFIVRNLPKRESVICLLHPTRSHFHERDTQDPSSQISIFEASTWASSCFSKIIFGDDCDGRVLCNNILIPVFSKVYSIIEDSPHGRPMPSL